MGCEGGGGLNAAVCPQQFSKGKGCFSIQLVVNISEIKLGFIVCCSVVQEKMEQREGGLRSSCVETSPEVHLSRVCGSPGASKRKADADRNTVNKREEYIGL